MKNDYGSMEGILSGAGVAVAASIVMLVVLAFSGRLCLPMQR